MAKKSADYVSHTTGQIAGVRSTSIFYQEWAPPKTQLRGGIIVVHGYAEHGGRYSALAEDLVSAGFAVGAVDHRGHGKSEGKRVQVEEFDDYVDDLAKYEKSFRQRYPAPLPLFILGHSMGGLITLRYVTRDKPGFDGIVISGTAAAKPDDVSSLTVAIGNILAKVAPDVGVVSLPLEKISRDPKVVADYKADPLVFDQKVRARLGAGMLKAMEQCEQALPSVTTPILILHGGDDVLTPPSGSRMIDKRIGSDDKTLEIYDGLWHEIFNEPERDVVIADVVAWLDRQIGKPAA